jgi:hypothetical protein
MMKSLFQQPSKAFLLAIIYVLSDHSSFPTIQKTNQLEFPFVYFSSMLICQTAFKPQAYLMETANGCDDCDSIDSIPFHI